MILICVPFGKFYRFFFRTFILFCSITLKDLNKITRLTLNKDNVVELISWSSGASRLQDDGGRERGSVLCLTPASEPANSMSLGGNSSRSRRPSIFCFCIAVPLVPPPSLASLRLYRNFIISPTSPHRLYNHNEIYLIRIRSLVVMFVIGHNGYKLNVVIHIHM